MVIKDPIDIKNPSKKKPTKSSKVNIPKNIPETLEHYIMHHKKTCIYDDSEKGEKLMYNQDNFWIRYKWDFDDLKPKEIKKDIIAANNAFITWYQIQMNIPQDYATLIFNFYARAYALRNKTLEEQNKLGYGRHFPDVFLFMQKRDISNLISCVQVFLRYYEKEEIIHILKQKYYLSRPHLNVLMTHLTFRVLETNLSIEDLKLIYPYKP